MGSEYCRAILAEGSDIEPLPILRVGGGYADTEIRKNFSSATALRAVLGESGMRVRRALKANLPDMVYPDAVKYRPTAYETAALCAVLSASEEQLSACPDCSEGLENRIRTMARLHPETEDMLEKVISKRYTRSRVKRILLQNFLGVRLKAVKNFLASPLYVRTLAVRREGGEELLAALARGSFPLVARKSDFYSLKRSAADCFALDMRANDLYGALTHTHLGEFETLFID